MKRKNPYILVAIIWAVLTVAFAVSSVVLFVDGELAIGALLVCVACGFAFVAGRIVEKALQIAELNRQQKWLHDFAKSLHDLAQEEAKRRENEPFAEFDKPSEMPFEEVRNKENLR